MADEITKADVDRWLEEMETWFDGDDAAEFYSADDLTIGPWLTVVLIAVTLIGGFAAGFGLAFLWLWG